MTEYPKERRPMKVQGAFAVNGTPAPAGLTGDVVPANDGMRETPAAWAAAKPDSDTEQHRHACEARLVASWPEPKREQFLANVEQKRGAQAAQELRLGVAELLRWRG